MRYKSNKCSLSPASASLNMRRGPVHRKPTHYHTFVRFCRRSQTLQTRRLIGNAVRSSPYNPVFDAQKFDSSPPPLLCPTDCLIVLSSQGSISPQRAITLRSLAAAMDLE